MTERYFDINGIPNVSELFGAFDQNLLLIEKELDVQLITREGVVKILGEDANTQKAVYVFENLKGILEKGDGLSEQDVRYAVTMAEDGIIFSAADLGENYVCITAKGRPIKAKTLGQSQYVDCIRKNTVTFGIGPAGTGKTYLAVALAVDAFRKKQVSKIVLTRPAVEAGEKLGFLPGDLQNKVDPYLRPLYDALSDMLGSESYQKYFERGLIEVAPLAYMRGRTLDDAFIILDEAQNTTPEQMKMFLTRIGFGSKAIITGDITQIDLPDGKRSGLRDVMHILKNIEGIEFMFLTAKDVVRHPLVQKIIDAYEKNMNKRK
ncbi:MAG: PhoH family protein [Clostridia bacterium]|nr:PhoH family protein [Clostridia bacterium]